MSKTKRSSSLFFKLVYWKLKRRALCTLQSDALSVFHCITLHFPSLTIKNHQLSCQLHSSNMHPCWLIFDNLSGLLTFQWHIAGGWISATKGISSSSATRISVANKELKKFKIRNDDLCAQWKNPDSLEHTFLQCLTNVKFYHEILSRFNVSQNTSTNLFPEKILLQKYILGHYTNDNLDAD